MMGLSFLRRVAKKLSVTMPENVLELKSQGERIWKKAGTD